MEAVLSGKAFPSPETRPGGGEAETVAAVRKEGRSAGQSGGQALSNSSGWAASRGRVISMAS
jgi:hypothetical protein